MGTLKLEYAFVERFHNQPADLVVVSHHEPQRGFTTPLYSYAIYAKGSDGFKGYDIQQFLGGTCDMVGLVNCFHDAYLPDPRHIAWQPITEQEWRNLVQHGEMPSCK